MPVASVWKFRCGPPHCVHGTPGAAAALAGTAEGLAGAGFGAVGFAPGFAVWAIAGAASAMLRNVRRSIFEGPSSSPSASKACAGRGSGSIQLMPVDLDTARRFLDGPLVGRTVRSRTLSTRSPEQAHQEHAAAHDATREHGDAERMIALEAVPHVVAA